MSEKTVGYSLIAVGIIIILFALVNMIFVFTGKVQPVQLFSLSETSLDLSALMPRDITAGDIPPSSSPVSSISPALLNQSSNLLIHAFLMGFLVTVGGKIASIGTMLVRPIVVKLKTKPEETVPTPPKSA